MKKKKQAVSQLFGQLASCPVGHSTGDVRLMSNVEQMQWRSSATRFMPGSGDIDGDGNGDGNVDFDVGKRCTCCRLILNVLATGGRRRHLISYAAQAALSSFLYYLLPTISLASSFFPPLFALFTLPLSICLLLHWKSIENSKSELMRRQQTSTSIQCPSTGNPH